MTTISFVGVSQGIRTLKISGAMTFCPSLKVSWMDIYCNFYDGKQGLEMSYHMQSPF